MPSDEMPKGLAGDLAGELVRELVEKVADTEEWNAMNRAAKSSRYCSRPIHLVPTSAKEQDVRAKGLRLNPRTYSYSYRGLYSKACGSRRDNICKSCSQLYKGDARQLVKSGLIGGKGIPEDISSHPQIFATLTAPSFGPVHRFVEKDGKTQLCRPSKQGRCSHEMPLGCFDRHGESDEILGAPICRECYDYRGAVVWNALSTRLWQRTTIYLRRELAKLLLVTEDDLAEVVKISYVKVIEFQRRGVIHLHIVVRADDAKNIDRAPTLELSPENLEVALRLAVKRVKVKEDFGDETRVIRWGEQIDTRPIHLESSRAVTNYLAKYATKSANESPGFDRRFKSRSQIESAKVPEHIRTMALIAWDLGQDPLYGKLNLAMWAHDLGHRGHFLTKSRKFSVTFKHLREERRSWQASIADEDPEKEEYFSSDAKLAFVGQGWLSGVDAYWAKKLREDQEQAKEFAREQFVEEQEREGM